MMPGTRSRLPRCFTLALCLLACVAAHAQLRVATWNVSNYDGADRVADIQTAVYGAYQGRSLAPDVIIGQEFVSQTGVTVFLNALNSAPGSPADWAAAPFVNGPDTDSAFFHRTSKVTLTDTRIVASGGVSPNHPRNIMRYTVRLHDYASDGGLLACYSSHMKAQDSGSEDDEARRLLEAQRIRDDAQTLSSQVHFVLGGDFNIQASSEDAYVELAGSQANNGGRFFDPIKTPGNWNNTEAFRFVHTQDPIGSGGMDDRFDQLLVSDNLIDGDGFEYIGNSAVPYSTATWNDPNHSYRAWGNDGTSFNAPLTIPGNTMVGAVIAQALVNVADGAGHLPVFMDLRVPPEVGSDASIDFGLVVQGDPAEAVLQVWNDADIARWTAAGIASLRYTLAASSGFTAPGGTSVDAAGGGVNQHTITMLSDTPGPMIGTVTINSNAPDEPSRIVTLVGEVLVAPTRRGDANCDESVDFDDINPFVMAITGRSGYEGTYPECPWLNADCNDDDAVDFDDINPFVALLVGQ